jgi:hypothetical protein
MTKKNLSKEAPKNTGIEHVSVVIFPYTIDNYQLAEFKKRIQSLAVKEDSFCGDKYFKYLKKHFKDGALDSSIYKSENSFFSYYKLNSNAFNTIYNRDKHELQLDTGDEKYEITLKDNSYILINEFNGEVKINKNHIYIVLSFKIEPKNSKLNNSSDPSIVEKYIAGFKPVFFRELSLDRDSDKYHICKFQKPVFNLKHDEKTQCFILYNKTDELTINYKSQTSIETKGKFNTYKIELQENEKNKFEISLKKISKTENSDTNIKNKNDSGDKNLIGRWMYDTESHVSTPIALTKYKLHHIIDAILNPDSYSLDKTGIHSIITKYPKIKTECTGDVVLESTYKKPILLNLFNLDKHKKTSINDAVLSKFKNALFNTLRLKESYEIEEDTEQSYFSKTQTGVCMVALDEGAAILEMNMKLPEIFKKYFTAFIFALNQREVLLRINELNANVNFSSNKNEKITKENYAEIEKISTYFTLFNYKQVFYVISPTYELKLFYAKLQEAFSIDVLLKDIKESVADVQFLLDRNAQEIEEKQGKMLEYFVLFLTIAQVASTIIEYGSDLDIPKYIITTLHAIYTVAFFIALIYYLHTKKKNNLNL